jgi:hypothetical protein
VLAEVFNIAYNTYSVLREVWGFHCVKIAMLYFWVVTLYVVVGRYQCVEGIYCLHFQFWKWKQNVSLKHWYLLMSPHGITTQKKNIIVVYNLFMKTVLKLLENHDFVGVPEYSASSSFGVSAGHCQTNVISQQLLLTCQFICHTTWF